ncbi:MAG: RNA polymerase sigma-70 factor (ECF subfamily) [Phycisphaerales bacterium]|jgi:RNA polymerase sigma-70 factor (ECF subfamily)
MSGDREALQAVWRAHRRWVAVILMAHKPRETDVEDLLQVVAVQLCRKIQEIREPEAFRPWLRTVAINAARATGRKATRRRRHTLHLVTQAPQPERHEADPETRDEGTRLLRLAREMPESYREPLLLRCLQGMSYRQISEVLDLPETTIETRIARGRRMLREAATRQGLGDTDADTPPADRAEKSERRFTSR